MTIPEQQMQMAVRLARLGDVERAQILFTQIAEIHPENFQAWLWLSELTDDIETQTRMLDKALEHMPEGADGRKDLQAHLNEIRGIAPASTAPSPAAPKKLNHKEVFEQAERLTINGKRGEALEQIRKLTDAHSTEERVWLLYSELNPGLEEKIAGLEKVIEIHPGNMTAHARLERLQQVRHQPFEAGSALEEWGEFEQAAALYQAIASGSGPAEEQLQARNHLLRLKSSGVLIHEPEAPGGLRKVISQILRWPPFRSK